MDFIQAKVHAAKMSLVLGEIIQIVTNSKDADDFLLDVADHNKKSVTWYQNGCEKNKGYHPPVSKDDLPTKKKRNRTAAELIDELGTKKEKPVKKVKEAPAGSIKMNWRALRKEVENKNTVFNSSGKSIPCIVRAEQTPEKEVNVKVVVKGKRKEYHIC